MKNAKAYCRRSQAGQTILELALLLPLFLLLVMGVFDIGKYMYVYILVGNAARAGAAYGTQNLALSADTAGIQQAAQNDYQNNGGISALSVGSSFSCGCDSAGSVTGAACTGTGAGTCASGHWVVTLTVTTSGTFNPLFGIPGVPASVSVTRTATMRVAPI